MNKTLNYLIKFMIVFIIGFIAVFFSSYISLNLFKVLAVIYALSSIAIFIIVMRKSDKAMEGKW